MGLFSNKSDSQSAIIALESENADLREQFTALQSAAAESAERVVSLRTELSGVTAELETAKAEKATADELTAKAIQEASEANEKLSTFDAKVESAAQAKFEGLGGPPIPSSNTDEVIGNSLTRVEFSNMKPHEKSEYLRNGGKLKD